MPTITKIEQQKRNQHRFNVYLDDAYAFGISEDVYVRYHKLLSVGKEISLDHLEQVVFAEEIQKVLDSAWRLLSFRPRSEKELINRLKQKGYEEKWIEEAIQKLKDYRYINDESFARSFASDRLNIKKIGSNGLKYELKQKGISSEIIEEVLDDLVDEEKEFEQGVELCEKKLKTLKETEPFKKKQKLLQFLVRKGYSFDTAKQVVSHVNQLTDFHN